MWTDEHRETYKRVGGRYPGDLTDAEWAVLQPLVPPALPGGRPRKASMREALNAILYLLRTGCPWRYLPGDGFPPRPMACNIFRKFQKDGTWETVWSHLHMQLREHHGREASPTACIIDSQTLKAAEKGGPKAKAKQTQWVMTPESNRGKTPGKSFAQAIPKRLDL